LEDIVHRVLRSWNDKGVGVEVRQARVLLLFVDVEGVGGLSIKRI
jgi:hypothetical protein